MAVIDLASGHVLHPVELGSSDHRSVDEALFDADGTAVHFRPDSRPLAVIGTINGDVAQHGISWFIWENEGLRRIRFQPAPAREKK